MRKIKQKIVTIGGGTGSFTVLSGLKYYPVDISAIVSMADDGGSTGVLRDEMGVLPPGDVRQCLVALSESGQILRELFKYRFSEGKLTGHTFGNIFLSGLEKVSGSFDRALEEASKILRIEGRVIPVTLDNINLIARLNNNKIIFGEYNIKEANLKNLKKLSLKPRAKANQKAVDAILKADKIVVNPGDLFCSIIPNLLVSGIAEAVKKSKAKKICVVNLMNKSGQTDNFSVTDYVFELEKYLGKDIFDYVVYNKEKPSQALLKKYASEGEDFVRLDPDVKINAKLIGVRLLSKKIYKKPKGDPLNRTLIRHDSAKTAKIIIAL